jgi:aminoglycoside phosphotransferase (APT) family kinase protein
LRNISAVSDLEPVLAEAIARAGLHSRGAALLRVGTNAVFRLTDEPVVVRIGLTADARSRHEKEVRVARWLASIGIPAARLATSLEQPVVVRRLPITFWEWLPIEAEPPSMFELGLLLRRLHDAPTPVELEAFDPLALPRARQAHTSTGQAERTFLFWECERLADDCADLRFELSSGPIHGDLHVGNVVRSGGQPVLLDFETFAEGHREWDLLPIAHGFDRFGSPSAREYQAFEVAYGFDIRSWPGYRLLARARDLVTTIWLMDRAEHDPTAAGEFRTRVADLRDGGSARTWRAF